MKKSKIRTPTTRGRFTLGRESFEKISEIEGVRLSPEMKRDFREFDRSGLSDERRREYLRRKYAGVRS